MSTTPPGSPAEVPTCYRHADRETYISCQRCGRPICPDCMRDASVGFQCPECVAEGRRTTRSGRTAYGGLQTNRPGAVTATLLGICVVVWLVVVASGGDSSPVTYWLMFVRDGFCGVGSQPELVYSGVSSGAQCSTLPDGSWFPGVADGAVWRLVSHAFVHVELWHIAVNMIGLWQLGPQLERLFGAGRFLALYLLAGIAGGVMILWFGDAAVGASGALFGLLAATLVVAKKVGADLSRFGFVLVLAVVISLAPGVSWQGHLGGFLGGAAVSAVLVYAPRQKRGLVQGLGVGAVAAALAVATVLGVLVRG